MRLLDGRSMAADIGRSVVDDVERLAATGVTPTLAVVLPTADEAARSYVRVIERGAAKVGVGCAVHELTGDPDELTATVDRLAADPAVHGMIVQTPLPDGLTAADVGARIPVGKDVDGMNPLSLGRLALGLPAFAPATAAAVLEILNRAAVPLAGARACVIGRSSVVGKPAALLLLAEDATVTVCHSRTKDLATVAHDADIVVAAVGRPKMVGAGHVRPGAVVIDVGTNWTDVGLVGDVDADAVAPVAGALTPVPGGVGPVTTMLLLRNTVRAAGG
ncbi:bifunctional 5,10-methylene-tetrahydrofolate dehydrogenase/5,10-methylene-tetrahydrofolate cyclohydrolase [Parafrankia soli]|uniref:Bifunctional protein FolD n=1 Tax=Parafrankia soli TaxID=2599596 RepID=A0A1S1Q2P7_9ACTN|nr:bifunctional 5,10-methylenetetrahydrofolate dehydrogenase/5,10-methenyltetrahydrofolate cyclohydrolase [Parafrankia soli]OHV27781.1 bifunctional 5,10-methylene-tetrahydrofolate dehydrogenase/5,10-methylene-tetrahydrofolate cyclohydrolase [Parafrankia soli]